MEIIKAKTLGFCAGVRRAVDLACAAADSHQGQGTVYSLGPLVHNPQVLEELRQRGIEILDEANLPESLHGAPVIIRAHGVSPHIEAELQRRGAALIDATCLKVKSSQLKAREFARGSKGAWLFLAGEADHAEIIGIRGYAYSEYENSGSGQDESRCIVVSNAVEAKKAAAALYDKNPGAATAIIGQTTISSEEYREICAAITAFYPNLEITQTICAATSERQDSLRLILDKVDAVIIAGGRDSANTRRLLAIAEATGKPCALIEDAADIAPEFCSFNTIGLASGASTPDSLIAAIADSLQHNVQSS